MTQQTQQTALPDAELKARHRAMWAFGDYPAVATQLIPELGQVLVEACGIGPGDRVIDIAAGSGNASVPAALAGADVVATDLTPELLEAGRVAAERDGVRLAWQEADAEALPFAAGEFDAALSVVGIMFAPHHAASADELVRVVRPGGTIGLVSWTPEGFIGQMFATMKPFAPPPPPGVQPPPLWGREDHVRGLLGDRVTDVRAERRTVTIDQFATGEQFRDFFKATYGPTIAVYKALADQPERRAALDAELAELAGRYDEGGGAMQWEYLLLTARRA
jgi:SAM-dependent methyltransferase